VGKVTEHRRRIKWVSEIRQLQTDADWNDVGV
jgi:hypothetical protein